MLKFLRETEKTAKSTETAIAEAMSELNVTDINEVDVEILDEGSKGFLGLGSKDAHVKLTLKDVNSALAKQFLSSIFDAMNLEVDINTNSEEGNLKIDLTGKNMGIIIGKRGDTLDSLQYLTSLVVNHENNEYVKLTLDTENYREKRMEALLALADRLAQKVARTGKKYTLEPMNPYERRIIHATLQENDQVTTFSVGEDPYRKVVIAPKNAPTYKKPHTPHTAHTSNTPNTSNTASYASSYSSYKKTAPRYDNIKKAENFEAYQSAKNAEQTTDDNFEE